MEHFIIDDIEILMRIMTSLVAGGIIGFERERKGKPAGFVTNVLVCVGAASIAVIQSLIVRDTLLYDYPIKSDPGRLIAQVVSGVGFLGAGAILHEKGSVKGITTAATIWVVAAIGIAFGMGYYLLGVIVTVTVYFSIMILKKIEFYFLNNRVRRNFYIEYCNPSTFEEKLELFLLSKAVRIRKLHRLEEFERDESSVRRSAVEFIIPRYMDIDDLSKEISLLEEVTKFKRVKPRK